MEVYYTAGDTPEYDSLTSAFPRTICAVVAEDKAEGVRLT